MEFLTSLFYHTFSILYSIFFQLFKHPIFATYLFILVIMVIVTVKLYQYLRSNVGGKGSLKEQLRMLLLIVLELYLIGFIIWYLFIHFKTYRIMT